MKKHTASGTDLGEQGFAILNGIFSADEVQQILAAIEKADPSKDTFRKSGGLFAIRQFLKEIPEAAAPIFNENLKRVTGQLFGDGYFVVKSIYFDKPADANWFVSYHRDLTISVDKKTDLSGFGPWTVKQNQFAVQPPLEILNSIYTIRIHLDDTNEENGALKVIPGSHQTDLQIQEPADTKNEVSCAVEKGGIMIMRPLLLHSSSRTINNKKRRVIHIEFSNCELPAGLNWPERMDYKIS